MNQAMEIKIPTRSELVQRARDFIPTLAERSSPTEEKRCISEETIADMQRLGFFKILQPKRWGGFELDPQTFYDVQMTIAEGCMSTAWVLGVVAVHNWQLPLFDEQAQIDVWGEDPTTLICSSYAPVGKVEHVEGGFNFSGRWSFSSGCDHVEWAFLGGMVPPAEGAPKDAPPDMRTFLIPKADYRIEDTWHVFGLCGTGSKDVVVENAFVPEHRTHKALDGFTTENPGNKVNPGPLYRLPFGQVFARAVSSAAIGALEGARQQFIGLSAERVTSHGQKVAEEVAVQEVLSETAETVDELKTILFRNFDMLMECVEQKREIPMEDRVRYRYQSAIVPQKCSEAVDKLLMGVGGRGLFLTSPVQRFFRDIYAGRAHVANNPHAFSRNWGRVQFGQPSTDFFL